MNTDRLEKLLQAYEDAAFAAGEWDRNESDKPYAAVMARVDRTKRDLVRFILRNSKV